MKSTGIVRQMDEQGRVVLPKELRRSYNIHENDPLEIYTDNGAIVLMPCRQQCDCCDRHPDDPLIRHRGMQICRRCLGELRRM